MLAVGVALTATLSTSAGASTAMLGSDGVLRVTGTAGVDQLTISGDGGDVIVRDGFTATVAGPGCRASVLGWVTCPVVVVARIEVELGGGDDAIVVRATRPVDVRGGDGDDALMAGGSPIGVSFDGGAGDDHLAGSPFADAILGGPGDDGIDGAGGADAIAPGAGRDVVDGGLGDDVVEARDGEPDAVDCRAGRDRVVFDAADTGRGCAGAPVHPPASCVPEIAPPDDDGEAARLVRGAALHVALTVADGCDAGASLAVAGTVYARAAASASRTGVTLRLSAPGRRALRQHGSVVLAVRTGAPGSAAVTRRFRLAL